MLLNKIGRKARTIAENPGFHVMRTFGRFNALRPLAMNLLRQPVSDRYDLSQSIFPDLDVDAVVAGLRSDGYYRGLKLPQATLSELVDFAHKAPCYGNRNPAMGFTYAEKDQVFQKFPQSIVLGKFFNSAEQCPAVHRVENDPKLLAIAALYLRSLPVHQGSNMWWSFAGEASPEERSKAAQLYHIDLDDYRFVKFFFYLTPVDADHGPHVIVRGTHNAKRLDHQAAIRRFTDEEIAATYGADRVITIYGEAGSGFAEDTLCFHKGEPPVAGDRLVLQIEYGLRDYNLQHDRIDPAKLKRCI
jgi:hypothetical protein